MLQLKADEKIWVDQIWEKIDRKLEVVSKRSSSKIPFKSIDGIHDDMAEKDINWWTNGFWPGLMWLMYFGTKKEGYRLTAERCEELLEKGLQNFSRLSHDVGFVWRLAAGPDYTITRNEKAKTRQFYAAEHLMSRYNPTGEFIRAWNHTICEMDETGITIIDTMMNLPLLYWMSEELNDPRFEDVAKRHADTTLRDHIRSDYSINHIVDHDAYTGEVIKSYAGQGCAEWSAWSRGQAWAIYGFVLSYIHTDDEKYLEVAKNTAHYFIANVCDDWVPKCDFRASEEPVIFDTSAGTCAACGLIEIANIVPENESRMYLNAAINMLKAIDEKYSDWSAETDFIVNGATGAYNKDIEQNIIYADYFFAEAIYKLKGFETLFW